jgi:hypothetical protein
MAESKEQAYFVGYHLSHQALQANMDAALDSMKSQRVLPSAYIVRSVRSAGKIWEDLVNLVGRDGALFVIPLTCKFPFRLPDPENTLEKFLGGLDFHMTQQ